MNANPDSRNEQPKRTPEQLLKDLWHEMRELGADEYMRNEAMSVDHGSSYWALEPVDWAHSRVCDILWEIAELTSDTQYMGIPEDGDDEGYDPIEVLDDPGYRRWIERAAFGDDESDDGPSSRYCYAEDEGGAE